MNTRSRMSEFLSIFARQFRNLHYRAGSKARCWFFRFCYPEIVWGRSTTIESNVDIRVTDGGRLILGDHVTFCRNSTITVQGGLLEIGANSHVGQACVIICQDRVSIGDDALIAEHVTIRDQDHVMANPDLPYRKQGFVVAPIRIGRNVWLGAKVTVTKGVSIGSNSVLGANSVVTSDIADNSVAVGAPARRIRDARPAGN